MRKWFLTAQVVALRCSSILPVRTYELLRYLTNTKMENSKILEQFHYFNIQAEIDSVFGNWVVSTEGDVVNYLYPYAILSIHFKETDWIEKMKSKVWFRPECEESLSKALERAKEILNK